MYIEQAKCSINLDDLITLDNSTRSTTEFDSVTSPIADKIRLINYHLSIRDSRLTSRTILLLLANQLPTVGGLRLDDQLERALIVIHGTRDTY
jgi:hypothetical protein